MGTVPEGTPADVDQAVAAARKAFPAWAATSVEERAKYCARIAEGLAARMDEIATLVSQEVGMVKPLSLAVQAGLPLNSFNVSPSVVSPSPSRRSRQLADRARAGRRGRVHHPVELPLHQIAAKVAYALAAGLHRRAQALGGGPAQRLRAGRGRRRDRPAGGGVQYGLRGRPGGRRGHRRPPRRGHGVVHRLDPGRPAGGRALRRRIAKVALELGGKSANVILPDADFGKAVADGVGKAYLNSGQTCSALTRMLVPRDRLAEAEDIAAGGRAR